MTGPEERWWSRGYHPHLDSRTRIQHVSIHLADSLPRRVLERMSEELAALPPRQRTIEQHHRVQVWLDAGHGCCLLREPWAAELVQSSLLCHDGQRHHLLAWVVMPNHVHAVVDMLAGQELRAAVASWKKYTARRLAADMPDQRVWLREYFDRYVRDDEHLAAVIAYVHNNPVKAGPVVEADQWPWSSARRDGQARQ